MSTDRHEARSAAQDQDEPLPTKADPRLVNILSEPSFAECFVPRWLREWWANRGTT